MKLPLIDGLLWAAGPLLNVALLGVLYARARMRTFRLLTTWCVFSVASMAVLFVVYRSASAHTYAVTYWTSEVFDAILQIGVVSEVARIVAGHGSSSPLRLTWSHVLLGGVGVAGALLLVSAVNPVALTHSGVWEIRGELFTSLLISEMFAFVLVDSQRTGLHWRSHVMSIGYGLMTWAAATILVGLLHGYWGRNSHYMDVEHIRMLAYLSMLAYWSIALWRDEPERERATPEMREKVLQVTERLRYDLAKVLTAREKESR